MTREIKFKAWNNLWKDWINDDFTITNCGNYVYCGGDRFNRDEVELVQFTGLLDKNGKEIYEGDILADTTAYYYTLIGYDVAGFKTKSVLKGGLNLGHGMPTFLFKEILDVDDFDRMEVVGNFYQKPELLEGNAN